MATRPAILLKAASQLGLHPLAQYGAYALKLHSGLLRLQTPPGGRPQPAVELRALAHPASPAELRKLLGRQVSQVLAEADEILKGRMRLFGADPRALRFDAPQPLQHWTSYAKAMPDGSDIKPVWEVGRLGWATTLARAYWLSVDGRYAEGFWRLVERFLHTNPVNMGPQWSSAQEVALRLVSLCFGWSLVAGSPASSIRRKELLSLSLAQHAERIPPTLAYAKAQNNNHLLSEALGLWTAGLALPTHPYAASWREQGRTLFVDGIARQITPDGVYAQHSSNYQRLALQLGVWAAVLAAADGEPLPPETRGRLSAACGWLLALLDEPSGRLPNLGPNDGAYILPLSVLPFADYRPALQAATAAFGMQGLRAGIWDEIWMWLGLPRPTSKRVKKSASFVRLESRNSWAYLRVAQFEGRPGHADQLHLDLWWRGSNITQDAGTYLYTAAAPWDNALASTAVHNTLMLDGGEQMTRAGGFLWLDWAQAWVLKRSAHEAVAEHDGYRRLGLTHRRQVTVKGSTWAVTDRVLGSRLEVHSGRLHWLLPDWPWKIVGDTLRLRSPRGVIRIQVPDRALNLIRAGRRVHGRTAAAPTAGWASPTYGVKQPALALVVELSGDELGETITKFILPK